MTQKIKRKKRDTSAIHNQIIDGAINIFTKYGFDAASMDNISEEAGVSKRTVYNHFASKDDKHQAYTGKLLINFQIQSSSQIQHLNFL